MLADRNSFHVLALSLAPQAAAVANYCDHVDHNEPADVSRVTAASDELRRSALSFAFAAGLDLFELYAERLAMIEDRNVLKGPKAFDGHAAALGATTWRDLQIVQAEHDRFYHPDVVGLAKIDQLRHYVLHLAKIVGAFAEADDADALLGHRLPDTLLFAIKLQTVIGERLSDDALPRASKRTSFDSRDPIALRAESR
jgi:hypothetical protein